jgi:hypothetical protein
MARAMPVQNDISGARANRVAHHRDGASRSRYIGPVKSVVLIHPDGDRVELFIDGRRVDWVHVRRFKPPMREQMVYETPSDIERALLVRFADLTKRGFTVSETPAIARGAIGVNAEALERGLAPLVVQRLDATDRKKAGSWLREHEQSGFVAVPGIDEKQVVPHIPSLHGFVLGMQARTLVLDADPARFMRQSVPEATNIPPHRAWLYAWLDAVHETPGTVRDLCLRACRLHELDSELLTQQLAAFEGLAFVGGFPTSFACAAQATRLTLGLTEPAGVLPDSVIEALAARPMRVEKLALELARGRQETASPLAGVLHAIELPQLRELAVTGLAPTALIDALVGSPILEQLARLRIDATLDAATLDVIRARASELSHLERFELRILPGSKVESLGTLATDLPFVVELQVPSPVCPY